MQTGTIIAVAAAVLLLVIILAGCKGNKPPRPSPMELDERLVGVYCDLVAAGQADEAYDRCLARAYRQEVNREKFVAAHAKRRQETGVILGRKMLHYTETNNFFDGERRTYIYYAITYPAGPQYLVVVLSDIDGDFKIEGTYRENAGETLDFLLW
ncbi:MAG TPA: hypothetical protein PLY66_06425 [Acidobacteriota bacterium]|nr:DUF4019 domain-containing protein [Acidobacteriota bacterium]HOT00623.1 hypothetical protein [Acidobacteriota bacterium]HQF87268.1 hypothetical protein [Acidobacteriota bacterium]HQG91842.1 hypothetical protein [Acidobacteriota bacterium]